MRHYTVINCVDRLIRRPVLDYPAERFPNTPINAPWLDTHWACYDLEV